MRLHYNTNGFAHHRLEDAIAILADLGYDGIALTPDVHHLDPLKSSAREVDAVAARVAAAGLGITIEGGARFVLDPSRKPASLTALKEFAEGVVDAARNLAEHVLPRSAEPGELGSGDELAPGAGAIVHLHSTHSAAVSCVEGLDADSCIPPLTAYFVMKIGRLPLTPYFRPGDPAAAAVISGLARNHAAVLLANHGPVVSGTTLEAAVYAVEELEETAKLFLLLRGLPVRALTESQIAELRDVFKLEL